MSFWLRVICIAFVVMWWCVASSPMTAQPHGWPCDYGYRPGNTWFYHSSERPYWITETVLRDSIGADGAYWVYISVRWPQHNGTIHFDYQLRIDSTCTFGRFENSRSSLYPRWFIAGANKGDEWVVDTLPNAMLCARVRGITDATYFDRPARETDVFYFEREEYSDSESHSATYVEGLGVVFRWGGRWNVGEYDVLVGAIIDGDHYGNTSSVEDRWEDDVLRLDLSELTIETR